MATVYEIASFLAALALNLPPPGSAQSNDESYTTTRLLARPDVEAVVATPRGARSDNIDRPISEFTADRTNGTPFNQANASLQPNSLSAQSEKGLTGINPSLWPSGRVPYFVLPGATPEETARIEAAMLEIRSTGTHAIVFEPGPSNIGSLLIRVADSGGCYSNHIGRYVPPAMRDDDRGFQPIQPNLINLQRDRCLRQGTIVHELMHALGVEHEQKRADRDQYITVNYGAIPNSSHWLRQYSVLPLGISRFVGSYDTFSLMHYSKCSPISPDCSPPYAIIGPPQIGNGDYLSQGDVSTLRYLYGRSRFGSGGSTGDRFAGLGDVSGDGRTDLVKWELASGLVTVLPAEGQGLSPVPTPGFYFGTGGNAFDRTFLVGDIDLNGFADILTWELATGNVRVALSGPGGFSDSVVYYFGTGGSFNDRFLALSDFDGDGRLDLIKWELGSGLVSVARWSGQSFASPIAYYFGAGGSAYDRFFATGDFNGDGRSDIARWELATGLASIAYSSGSSFVAGPQIQFGSGGNASDRFFRVGDVTGDGRDDLVKWELASGLISVAPAISGGFGPIWNVYGGSGGNTGSRTVLLCDVTGDGLEDFVLWEVQNPVVDLRILSSSGGGAEVSDFGALLNAPSLAQAVFQCGDVTGDGRADPVAWSLASGAVNWRSVGLNGQGDQSAETQFSSDMETPSGVVDAEPLSN